MLKGLINRGLFIGAIVCFMLLGIFLSYIGSPDHMKTLVSEKTFNMLYSSATPKHNDTTIIFGSLLIVLSTVGGMGIGLFCPMSRKDRLPKKIDVLRAQDVAVFLVDGKVFKQEKASFYVLEDLSRIRVSTKINLYYMELDDELIIAPEGKQDDENKIPNGDSEKDKVVGSNDNEKESDLPFTDK